MPGKADKDRAAFIFVDYLINHITGTLEVVYRHARVEGSAAGGSQDAFVG